MGTDSEQLYRRLMDAEVEFNSDEYGNLVNAINIEECVDPIGKLIEMSESDDYTVTMALAFILQESIGIEFRQRHVHELRLIIRKAMTRNYFRANCTLSEAIFWLPFEENDYLNYLKLIQSKESFLQNRAIENLCYLSAKQIKILAKFLKEYDFSLFTSYELIGPFTKAWFLNLVQGKTLAYKKIILVALYKQGLKKSELYEMSGSNDPDIFEFVFMYLPEANLLNSN